MILYFREAGLTWIEIWTVRNVVDSVDALLHQHLLHNLRLMYRQIVHKDGDPLVFIFSSEIEEVLFKLSGIYRFLEDLIEF